MANQKWGENSVASVAAAPSKNVHTYMVETGALLDTDVTTAAHNIANLDLSKIVDLWGVATDGTSVYPIPYTDNANDIALYIDATNVNLETFTDMTGFTASRVYFSVLS